MNRTLLLGLISVLSLGGAMPLPAQPASGETEKAVAALERQWMQSQKTNNPELLAPLLAEKFIATSVDGKASNKTQTLADAKATKWTSVEYENLQVTAFGTAAIATGVYLAKGTDSGAKPMNAHERFTDTWVKMPDGKWQCVASHNSTITK